MFKIALMKFESNLAVNIAWGKRETFKKWDRVIVWKEDILKLMRLGCTLINERSLTYAKNKDLFKVTKADIKEANEEFEKIVDNKTLEQLESFVEAPQFVKDCDEKYCTQYANDILWDLQLEKEEKEKAEKDAKLEAEKIEAEKIAKEKKEAEELEVEKEAKRLEAEKLGKAEKEKKEAEKIEALKTDSEKANKKEEKDWDDQNGKAPDWDETQK